MGLNKKIFSKEFKERLDRQSVEEKYSAIPENLIHFLNNNVVNSLLNKESKPKNTPSARVLNHWIKDGLIDVDVDKKNKIKYFNLVEKVWLNIIIGMREFGMSLENIHRVKKVLLSEVTENFSLLKFQIINCILLNEQTLVTQKDGHTGIYANEIYFKQLKKNGFLPHLSLPLIQYIKKEYPNNNFDRDIIIPSAFENIDKMLVLFFLKTGAFENIKVEVSKGDIRYVESTEQVLSLEMFKEIQNWTFERLTISITDKEEVSITSKTE